MSKTATSKMTKSNANMKEFLTVFIADQMFGIPVLQVQDVLGPQKVTRIPLAPIEVAGALNLRGRIVTTIDVRKRLQINKAEAAQSKMSVVVEHDNELYSLIIDRVGDVLSLDDDLFEGNPPTLDPVWKEISAGIYRLEDKLLVIIEVPRLLGSIHDVNAK
ncbi:MAG: chemotaxis protein CheW [Rhodospirillales bacterium]|nr:chemotaxis protein CheW [Rhodospirillales bacterium]MCB9973698.1 chemotaxis protein CheW [Rhodospirillales bacterium]